MEESVKKECPVCGTVIVGRKDKVFCSDDCRSYYHNMRYRERNRILLGNGDMSRLWDNAAFLIDKKSFIFLKFIVFLSGICKIISIFGLSMLKGERNTDS